MLMALVRVFEIANAVELAKARLLLEASGIDYFVEGEHYFAAGGGFISHGDTRVWIQVDKSDVHTARALLSEEPGSENVAP